MNRNVNILFGMIILLLVGSCSKKNDPDTQLPSYLRIPTDLTGYGGSGKITIDGDLTLRAEGEETLDPTTKTYSGVLGRITIADITAQFTAGQPLPYKQTSSVPPAYYTNGQLSVINTLAVGIYPMGYQSKPTPTGANADLILNLPGPQLYSARLGTLSISESTVIKVQNGRTLYRIQGTLLCALTAVGTGTKAGQDYTITGSFDLLLVN
ncbi:hypothetical protein GO755_27970 [Spirosoma sp. HMF4905]|uniref:Uncharacterized protein n=1 Tax=Spirosoma arboris TaxID=2682092 RepID=A0A7K1SJY8_9BACT|nr:hypothetical protein [Spirosoma arboris]MVM33906.1 hypothetical protein [Spirosoma arboris]